MIDKYKIKLSSFTAELPEKLDRDLRTLITAEVDIYDVGMPDNQDGTYDKVYKSKLVGTVIVKQGENKPVVTKSKRSASKRLRSAMWYLNPDEEFYQKSVDKIIANLESVIEFLKDK